MDYSYEYVQVAGTTRRHRRELQEGDAADTTFSVDVRNGKVVTCPDTEENCATPIPVPAFACIDDMFKEIERALKDKKDVVNTITFNDEYGYPENFSTTYEDGTNLIIELKV